MQIIRGDDYQSWVYSNEGDLVVDTFLGSGTTAIAAKNKKRRFKGCEIDKKYYDKIMELMG